jgi:hypothetical protein
VGLVYNAKELLGVTIARDLEWLGCYTCNHLAAFSSISSRGPQTLGNIEDFEMIAKLVNPNPWILILNSVVPATTTRVRWMAST